MFVSGKYSSTAILCISVSAVLSFADFVASQDGLSGDMAAIKRAAVAAGMKPEDMLKLGLPSEAAARLHALGVPPAMLNGRTMPNGAVPPPMNMASFHEQLLAAAAQQRSESQGVSLMH